MYTTRKTTPTKVGFFMFGIVVIAVMFFKSAESADTLYLCMKNCEQCKSMYGPYFEGDLCAKSCFRAKGAFIPDCVDIASIGSFLNKNE